MARPDSVSVGFRLFRPFVSEGFSTMRKLIAPCLLSALMAWMPCPADAQDSLELLQAAEGPALLCPEQNQLHGFSSEWPDGRPLAPNREPVAFVKDAEGLLKISFNPDNPKEMLIDRLTVVVTAYDNPLHIVGLEVGSDLIGLARLYAIAFDRNEVGSSWAVSSADTQAGSVWWRCRSVSPKDLLP